MKYDYADALETFNQDDKSGFSMIHGHDTANTIRHALRFAEKMMKKPSEESIEAGWNAFGGPEATFKAMRDAALKELGE